MSATAGNYCVQVWLGKVGKDCWEFIRLHHGPDKGHRIVFSSGDLATDCLRDSLKMFGVARIVPSDRQPNYCDKFATQPKTGD